MPPSAPHYLAPSPVERMASRLFGMLVGLGLGLPHNYLLQVRGRRSGRLYATPVDVLTFRDTRFVVAGRGNTQWVRNARASDRIVLRKGFRRESVRLRELPDTEKPAVLKAYLDRFRLTVQRYFPVRAGSPAADFETLAPRYPVFELIAVRASSTSSPTPTSPPSIT